MDLLEEFVEFNEFIIEDSSKQSVLKELQYYFPSIIKRDETTKYYLSLFIFL